MVDTNVVSYRYRVDDPRFEPFRPVLEGKIPAISFVTFAETLEGAYEAPWPEKRIVGYEAYLRAHYMLLPVDRELTIRWARLVAECRRNGIELGCDNDWWVAATALRYDIPLVTSDQTFRRVPSLTVLPVERT